MYEEFFGLKSRAFDLAPNPEFFFASESHLKALNYLKFGVYRGSGFIMLSGEVGTGKTTLVRDIMRSLDKQFLVSAVFYTCVKSVQLLQMINRDFGLNSTSKDKVDLISELNDFLIEQCARNMRPVVIIDEAQNLTNENLEELRLLSNLEGDKEKLLQIILVGQPELREKLANPELRQLRQRIAVNFHLSRLIETEILSYILHRLERAGNRDAVIFEDEACAEIFKVTQGTPRLINVLCDFLLLTAFSEQVTTITADMVRDVVESLNMASLPEPSARMDDGEILALGQRVDRHERYLLDLKKFLSGKFSALELRLKKLEDPTGISGALDSVLEIKQPGKNWRD